jgi:hypothetical protein
MSYVLDVLEAGFLEGVDHSAIQFMGYTHAGTNEYGLGGTRQHNYTHSDPMTKEHIKRLHDYLTPQGYQKERGSGRAQTAWKKGPGDYVIVTKGFQRPGHKLQISEPRSED